MEIINVRGSSVKVGSVLNLNYNGKSRFNCVVDKIHAAGHVYPFGLPVRPVYNVVCNTPDGWKQFNTEKIADLEVTGCISAL